MRKCIKRNGITMRTPPINNSCNLKKAKKIKIQLQSNFATIEQSAPPH